MDEARGGAGAREIIDEWYRDERTPTVEYRPPTERDADERLQYTVADSLAAVLRDLLDPRWAQ